MHAEAYTPPTIEPPPAHLRLLPATATPDLPDAAGTITPSVAPVALLDAPDEYDWHPQPGSYAAELIKKLTTLPPEGSPELAALEQAVSDRIFRELQAREARGREQPWERPVDSQEPDSSTAAPVAERTIAGSLPATTETSRRLDENFERWKSLPEQAPLQVIMPQYPSRAAQRARERIEAKYRQQGQATLDDFPAYDPSYYDSLAGLSPEAQKDNEPEQPADMSDVEVMRHLAHFDTFCREYIANTCARLGVPNGNVLASRAHIVDGTQSKTIKIPRRGVMDKSKLPKTDGRVDYGIALAVALDINNNLYQQASKLATGIAHEDGHISAPLEDCRIDRYGGVHRLPRLPKTLEEGLTIWNEERLRREYVAAYPREAAYLNVRPDFQYEPGRTSQDNEFNKFASGSRPINELHDYLASLSDEQSYDYELIITRTLAGLIGHYYAPGGNNATNEQCIEYGLDQLEILRRIPDAHRGKMLRQLIGNIPGFARQSVRTTLRDFASVTGYDSLSPLLVNSVSSLYNQTAHPEPSNFEYVLQGIVRAEKTAGRVF